MVDEDEHGIDFGRVPDSPSSSSSEESMEIGLEDEPFFDELEYELENEPRTSPLDANGLAFDDDVLCLMTSLPRDARSRIY